MSKFFAATLMIADEFKDAEHDTRTEMLQGLRDAMHPTCIYYRFLYRLVCAFRPLDIIEIGTYAGVSAAHMSDMNYIDAYTTERQDRLYGTVITVDINPDAARCVAELPIPNKPGVVIGDSMEALPLVKKVLGGKADVLYIDGQHTFARAYHEYHAYRQLVRDRGLIIIDDVGLDMDGDEMNVFWDFIPETKHRVDWLHPNVGFGIVEKLDHVMPVIPDVAIDRANDEIRKRRK